MSENLRIFLADDHPVVLDGLRMLVNAQADMDIVGEAVDGETAVCRLAELQPDVAVIDISLPGISGIDVITQLKQMASPTKVLTLTVHEDKGYVQRALSAGAYGYVLKRAASEELVGAIRTVASGGQYLDPALQSQRSDDMNGHSAIATGAEPLSEREEQVLRRIAQGFSNKEVASQLSISIKTVETYKARSLEKLKLRSRVDIIRYAVASGWLAAEGNLPELREP